MCVSGRGGIFSWKQYKFGRGGRGLQKGEIIRFLKHIVQKHNQLDTIK